MELPVVPGCLQVNLHWALNGPWVGSRIFLHYTAGVADDATCAAIAAHVVGSHDLYMAAQLSSSYSLVQASVKDLSSKTGGIGISTSVSLGTRPGATAPVDVCAVMNHKVRRQYRGGRPRTYAPYGVAGDITGGNQWSTAFQTSLSNGWSQWIAALKTTTSGLTVDNQVNIPYYKGFTPYRDPVTERPEDKPDINPNIVPDPIISSHVRAILGSQRRRLTL